MTSSVHSAWTPSILLLSNQANRQVLVLVETFQLITVKIWILSSHVPFAMKGTTYRRAETGALPYRVRYFTVKNLYWMSLNAKFVNPGITLNKTHANASPSHQESPIALITKTNQYVPNAPINSTFPKTNAKK
jgi:hypothetical protein